MAQGAVPSNVIVDLPSGLWKTPRWGGIETGPAACIIMLELLTFFVRSWTFTIIAVAAGAFWWYTLSQLFLRDERFLAIYMKTRPFHNLKQLRGHAIISTPSESLQQVLR